jgi:hypothetical protein
MRRTHKEECKARARKNNNYISVIYYDPGAAPGRFRHFFDGAGLSRLFACRYSFP